MQQHFPNIEALAADPQFIAWIRAGRPVEQGSEWAEWQTAFPEQAQWVNEAADLITALQFPGTAPTPATINAEWEQLQAKRAAPVKALPRRNWWMGIAATLLLLLTAGLGTYAYLTSGTYTTGYAEQKSILLDDGTEVTLQANSTLKVTEWNEAVRKISLEGEAFFTVARQADRPFTVMAGPLDVTVLGTRFNLVNRRSRHLVALEEGEVTVMSSTWNDVTNLVPGEVAAVNVAVGKVEKFVPANLEVYTSWRDGYWKLERTSLGEIGNRITDAFGTKVTFSDPKAANRELSGSLPADKLETLLSALSELLGNPVVYTTDGTIRF